MTNNEEVVITKEPTEEDKKVVASTKKKLLIFWLRMLGWLGAGVVAPITTFSIKFGLFTEYGYNITTDELGNVTGMHIALNGWGIVSVLLIALALFEIINEVIDAQGAGYTYPKQLLQGFKSRILPLAIALGVCWYLKDVLDQMVFCLIIVGISQTAAIALNPLPKWKYEKLGKEDYSDIITGLARIIKERSNKKGRNK